ncbi:hypothetical protein [Salinisphaera hydrothermalis]|uniref:hypothetical protein n=1 Tax=Salinisphaera hydrothermalis TaxID=563188 RepID=UPI00333FB4E1
MTTSVTPEVFGAAIMADPMVIVATDTVAEGVLIVVMVIADCMEPVSQAMTTVVETEHMVVGVERETAADERGAGPK